MIQRFFGLLEQWPIALLLVFSLAVQGCGCDEEDPNIVFQNLSSGSVIIHAETSSGEVIDIPDLAGGTSSSVYTIPVGTTRLALTWGSIPVPHYQDLEATYCYDYEVQFEGETMRINPVER